MQQGKEKAGENNDLHQRYANYFKVGYNAFEFIIDFCQCYGEEDERQFNTRIVTSPVYAKAFFDTLQYSLEQYEKKFGNIQNIQNDREKEVVFMRTTIERGFFGEAKKGKIGVLIEEHFDPTEFRLFNEYLPKQGYQVEYLSHLWGQPQLRFGSNPENDHVEYHVTVTTEVNDIDPADYKGILLIGAYATDRLRYQATVKKGQRNQAPAVAFLRKAMATKGLKIGTICHSLWLLCADPDLLKDRKVTCAHNIICDVENAGGNVIYEGDGTAELVIDGNLISGKHPGVVDKFMEVFVQEIEKDQ